MRLAASVGAGNVGSPKKKKKSGGTSQVMAKKKTQGGGIPGPTPAVADEYKVPMKTVYLPSLTTAINRKPTK